MDSQMKQKPLWAITRNKTTHVFLIFSALKNSIFSQSSGKMDENIVFGKSLQKKDEWNAG